MLRLVEGRKGRRPGEVGVTIQIYDQKRKSKTHNLTVHGITPQRLYNLLKFYLKLLSKYTENEVIELCPKKQSKYPK